MLVAVRILKEEIEQVPMYMLVRRRLKDCLNLKEEIDQLDEQGSEKRDREIISKGINNHVYQRK